MCVSCHLHILYLFIYDYILHPDRQRLRVRETAVKEKPVLSRLDAMGSHLVIEKFHTCEIKT